MNVLVISPHMDDETFGAGGTLLKYGEAGNGLYWLNITNSNTDYGYSKDVVEERERQRQKVAEKYGFIEAIDLCLKPTALKSYDDSEVISKISEIVARIKPEVLILPYSKDVHSDHGQVFDFCKPLTKSFRYGYIKTILIMEILSETDFALPDDTFAPNYFVDISDFIEKKIEIAEIFSNEIGTHPFPRSLSSIKALALLRGVVAGVEYAEAFKVLRIIEK